MDNDNSTMTLLNALQCAICNDRFTDPRICGCGHTFCLLCLKDYIRCQSNEPHLTCPLCHMVLTTTKRDIDKLPAHMFYNDLVKEIDVLEKDNKILRASCKFCNDDYKQAASVKCVTCQVTMCEECASHHFHNGVTNIIPVHRKQDSLLCDLLPKRETACKTHSIEPLLLYCLECKIAICFKCKDDGHANHTVDDLDIVSISDRASITNVQTTLKEYLDETKEALKSIDNISDQYHENAESTKQQIESQTQKLINHILRQKSELLQELDTQTEDIHMRLENNKKILKDKEARAQCMADLADNLLRYGNDAENTNYQPTVEKNWNTMKEEKLDRFGNGFLVNVRFFLTEGILDLLSKSIGTLRLTQTLSAWTTRKNAPIDVTPLEKNDASSMQRRMKSAITKDFSQKRSQVFSRFVDPKWTLETYKTSSSTGQVVTAWLRTDEEQDTRISKRISLRSVSSPCIVAEICSFSEQGEPQYQQIFEKLPDGTMIRLAIGGPDRILMAVYPGALAASIIGQAKWKPSTKKEREIEGIYVAVLEAGSFVCGELRKIPIPEGPGFDFNITSRGIIVLKSALTPDLIIYPVMGEDFVTDHGHRGMSILKIMESTDSSIVVVCKDMEGNVLCEKILEDGKYETLFKFPTGYVSPTTYDFKDACFDRNGDILYHLEVASQDYLYLVRNKTNQMEYLSKPDMLHTIDKVAVLPDGRLCIFDKSECVLMMLKYL